MKNCSTLFIAIALLASLILAGNRPAVAQVQTIGDLMQQHMQGQAMAFQGQAYLQWELQFQRMIQQLRTDPNYVAKAKEKLPRLESLALKLMKEIPGMESEVMSARALEEDSKQRRQEAARAVVNAKLAKQENALPSLEAALTEVRREESKHTEQVKKTVDVLVKAKTKLKSTARDIYKLHMVLGTKPSSKLTNPNNNSNAKSEPEKTNETSAPNKRVSITSDRLRKWTSADGKFSIYARLIRQEGDKVVLKKTTGPEIRVPITSLSEKDAEYLKSRE